MQPKSVLHGRLLHLADHALKPKRIYFKSERVQLDSKAKELLTKYRKGLIWKNNGI